MAFDKNINLEDWFHQPVFSDLTIMLSDGRKIPVHKIIVCARNEYFFKLCGPDSHFAQSEQKTIELKEDDPTALEHVLRCLYGFDLPKTDNWRSWLYLHVTADKYLIPNLSEESCNTFCLIALTCESTDDIFDIIETIRTEHLISLLDNDRFRTQLNSGGTDALWQQLDELMSKLASKPTSKYSTTDKVEKSYTLCAEHAQDVLESPGEELEVGDDSGPCTLCPRSAAIKYGKGSRMSRFLKGRASTYETRRAWIDE